MRQTAGQSFPSSSIHSLISFQEAFSQVADFEARSSDGIYQLTLARANSFDGLDRAFRNNRRKRTSCCAGSATHGGAKLVALERRLDDRCRGELIGFWVRDTVAQEFKCLPVESSGRGGS